MERIKQTGVGVQTAQKQQKQAVRTGSHKSTGPEMVQKARFGDSIADEIILILIILLAVMVGISIYTNKMGTVGQWIGSFSKGLFGFGAYVLPWIIAAFCIFLLADRKRRFLFVKIAGCILLLVTVSIMGHLAGGTSVQAGFLTLFQQGTGSNGGAVGGILGTLLFHAFGRVGAYLLALAMLLISLILATGKSFFSTIVAAAGYAEERKKKKAAYNYELEQKKAADALKKKKRPVKKKKARFDIRLEQGEGKETSPIVEASMFEKKKRGEVEKTPVLIRDCKGPMLTEIEIPVKEKEEEEAEEIEITEPVKSPFMPEPEKPAEAQAKVLVKGEGCIQILRPYVFPSVNLLAENKDTSGQASKAEMLSSAKKLEETLKSFGVEARVTQINRGPSVTRYELSPSQGVKVSRIVNLSDDIALNLAANGIRMEAPIPGKAVVGIEVPNKKAQPVCLREVLATEAFQKFPSKLAVALGQDIAGNAVVADIAKMPHLLIAGATGSGKSVCINTLITSLLYKATPEEVKLLLIDPKVVELSVYNGIPHLLIPVVTDPKKASGALNWAVREMLSRYESFASCNVRDIKGYNTVKAERGEEDLLPQIVIIIDELADLMMAAPGEVEEAVCRLAQMARAAGLHLIIATQRPSVDVITGVIKANIPSRLAFAVSSGVDSRTILDMTGAEKLLGKGDMLFYPIGSSKPVRIQGAFVSDKEVENIVRFVKGGQEKTYEKEIIEEITSTAKMAGSGGDADELLEDAAAFVIAKKKASASLLQRQFRIGYNRAARMMEDLETRGIVGAEEGSKPRRVLWTQEKFEAYRQTENKEEL